MAEGSLGYITVTTAGTPVRVTTTKRLVRSYMVQQHPDNTINTTKGYVGLAAVLDLATGVNLLGVIPPNTTGTISAFTSSASSPLASDCKDLSTLWLDSSANNQKFLVSFTDE